MKLTNDQLNEMLKNSADEMEFLTNLYKLVIPLEKVQHIEGWPAVNRLTAEYIINLMHSKYDTGNVAMLWLNKGFSCDEETPDFEINMNKCEVKLNPQIV